MELTPDLIRVQNIMGECERQVGGLSKFSHGIGNENMLTIVTDKLQEYFKSKDYLQMNLDANPQFDSDLQNIIRFLILNTKLNDADALYSIKEYCHLINIMPQLSKFLLIHIIIESKLIEIYSKVVFAMPMQIWPELFESASDTFVGGEGSKTLKNIDVFLKCLIDQLNTTDTSNNRTAVIVGKLNNITGQLLLYLSVHPSISMNNASEEAQNLHIGYTLLSLLGMMMRVDEKNPACAKIIDGLVLTTTIVTKHVTVGVYCQWVENIVHNGLDQALQYTVATEAYAVVEKYMKFKSAAELVSMLGCMAKKPQSLSQTIALASLETIVRKVDAADGDQRRWFASLLARSDLFVDTTARECLQRWSTLCTLDDTTALIAGAATKEESVKRLAIRCAAHLSPAERSILIVRCLFIGEPWQAFIASSNVQQSMTLLLNKIDSKCDVITEVQMMLLESPREVIGILLGECFKNSMYVLWLEAVFQAINNVMHINAVPLNILREIIERCEDWDSQVVDRITALFSMLLRTNCCDCDNLYIQVITPLLLLNEERLECILAALQGIDLIPMTENHKEEFILQLFHFLETHPVKYTNFSQRHVQIRTSCITIITKLAFVGLPEIAKKAEYLNPSKLNSYYLTWENAQSNPSLMSYVFPNFSTDSYDQLVSKLIRILSRCISQEWLQITKEIAHSFGVQKTVEALADALLLIGDVTGTQTTENMTVYTAMSFYVRNYGVCVQKMREMGASLEFEIVVVRNVCRIIQRLPSAIKKDEGVILICLLSDDALKALAKDKQFVRLLVDIDEPHLTQIIAKKMLA